MHAAVPPAGAPVPPTAENAPDGTLTVTAACRSCGNPVVLSAHPDEEPPRLDGWRFVVAVAGERETVQCTDCREAAERYRQDRRTQQAAVFREREHAERIARSGLPPQWLRVPVARLASPQHGQEDGFAAANRWVEGRGLGVSLHGPVGRGKTHIAAYAVRRWLDHERDVRWFNVATLSHVLSTEPFDSPRYAATMAAMRPADRPTALVLDDLDKIARPDARTLNPLYVLLNTWIESGYPVFVTANADEDGVARTFGKGIGEAIVSRVAGHCTAIPVGGPDRRRRQAVDV